MSVELSPIRVEIAFWVILCLGLATGIGLETDWGRKTRWPVPEDASAVPKFTGPVLAETFHLPSPDEFRDITQRPAFIVTRRPAPAAPPPEPPKPSMQKGQFVLMGTTVVADGKFAFLLEKAGNKSRVVAEGKEINGIMVKEVTAERVVLSQYDDTEVLTLRTNKLPPGAVAVPVQPQHPTPAAPPAIPGNVVPAPPPAPQPAFPGASQG
jgi:hypothetical protein